MAPDTPKMVRASPIGSRSSLLAIVAVIALATFRDYGLSWDDYTHAEYGDLLLAFYASGFTDQRALSFVNLYYYGGGFDLARCAGREGLAVQRVRDAPADAARRSASSGCS